MKNKSAPSAEGSSGNSTGEATERLLPASPLALEAVKELAVLALDSENLTLARSLLREQIQMLDQLIERSESEEEVIYEWASGQ